MRRGRRWVAVMAGHVSFDLGLQRGHRRATSHQVGDFLAGFLALVEIGCDCTAYQHGEMVAHGHGVHHLMGDEYDGKAALLGLIHDAQDVGGLFDAKGGGGLIQDQDAGAKVDGTGDRQRLTLASRQATDQAVAVVDAGDPAPP